jgi:alpha-galactosidase
MMKSVKQLSSNNDLATISDRSGRPLLENCYGSIQLSNGSSFSMHAMKRRVQQNETSLLIETGGEDDVLPHMKWEVKQVNEYTIQVTLSVRNTTPIVLPIERMDALVCPTGYRSLATDGLSLRRTGWQTFSPAALHIPFNNPDPWLQPPLYAPMTSPSSAQWQLPWMTILQSDHELPMLIGFAGAKYYLGTVDLSDASTGHRINAVNHVEGVELKPGQTFTTEPLLIMWNASEQHLLDEYGTAVGKYMQARVAKTSPTGWSHWLYYFAKVTEKDILENIQIIQERDLPFEYIQIDDGYQTLFGDWLSINDKFPHGMKYLADRIREAGRKPGIWLSPFMADNRSEVVRLHPEWFLRDSAGRFINVNRHGDPYWPAPNYGIDITHPEAYKWLKRVLTTMCDEWGYEYIKADFLYAGAVRAVRYDPDCTSIQAYRRGMALIRRIAGDKVVLGCGAPLLCSVGAVDNMRIGPDLSHEFDSPGVVAPPDVTLPLSREPLLSLFSHQWMNKKLWINDADYVRTRQHDIDLGWTELVALTSLIALGGGAIYDSDKLATLEQAGYDLLDRLFPVADISATTIDRETGKPSRVSATITKGEGVWTVAARFNWNNESQSNTFDAKQWKLAAGKYHIYNLTDEAYLGLHETLDLPDIHAKGVGLYSLCAVSDHPQVIGTKGHLLGPAGDIETVSWSDSTLAISLVRGRRTVTKVLVCVPAGFELTSQDDCGILEKTNDIYTLEVAGENCRLVFKPSK